jgi:hypothetical protein
MKIKSVRAYWVHIPIPHERQHVSDFGRTLSFDGTLVRIETACGITRWGEAKAQVGGMAQNQALTCMINEEFAPLLEGEDPRDITRIWETLYSGTRGHYALREGRVFPLLGRRGITISAISGVDCALWAFSASLSASRYGDCLEAGGPSGCRPMPLAAGPGPIRSASSFSAISQRAVLARSRCGSVSSTETRVILRRVYAPRARHWGRRSG